jgi:hypothetical protein
MNARIVIDPNTSHPAAVRIQCLFNFFLPSQNSSGIIHTSNTCGLREYHDGKGTYHSTSVAVLLPIDDDMMGTATATTVDCMLNRASLYDESSEFNSSETAGERRLGRIFAAFVDNYFFGCCSFPLPRIRLFGHAILSSPISLDPKTMEYP